MEDRALEGVDIAMRELPNNDVGAAPRLPLDLVPQIVQHLRGKDAYAALRVCRAWYDIALPALYHTIASPISTGFRNRSVNSSGSPVLGHPHPLELVKIMRFESGISRPAPTGRSMMQYDHSHQMKMTSLQTLRLRPSRNGGMVVKGETVSEWIVRSPTTIVCDGNDRRISVDLVKDELNGFRVGRAIHLVNPKDMMQNDQQNHWADRALLQAPSDFVVIIFTTRDNPFSDIYDKRDRQEIRSRFIEAIARVAIKFRGPIDIVGLEVLDPIVRYTPSIDVKTPSDVDESFEQSIRNYIGKLWKLSILRANRDRHPGQTIDVKEGLEGRMATLRFMTIRQYIQTDWRSDELDEEELLSWAPPRKDKEGGDE